MDLENLEASEIFELTLNQEGLSEEVRADFPYLADFAALELSEAGQARAPELLRGQLALVVRDAQGDLLDATGVQIPGVLDDLYAEAAYDEPLGVVWEGGVPSVRVLGSDGAKTYGFTSSRVLLWGLTWKPRRCSS